MNQELPPEFWQGFEQFNQGEFYACHDTLEAIWLEAMQPEKQFYQGILQVAVALYHLENQNLRGSIILLGEGLKRLRSYQPDYQGIDVESLLDQGYSLLTSLQDASAHNLIPTVPKLLLQKIES